MYPNEVNMIVVPTTKRTEIVTGIQVCFISQTNFNYKESGERKAFITTNFVYPNEPNMIIVLNKKKNRDCYEYPSLSHFMDEL